MRESMSIGVLDPATDEADLDFELQQLTSIGGAAVEGPTASCKGCHGCSHPTNFGSETTDEQFGA